MLAAHAEIHREGSDLIAVHNRQKQAEAEQRKAREATALTPAPVSTSASFTEATVAETDLQASLQKEQSNLDKASLDTKPTRESTAEPEVAESGVDEHQEEVTAQEVTLESTQEVTQELTQEPAQETTQSSTQEEEKKSE